MRSTTNIEKVDVEMFGSVLGVSDARAEMTDAQAEMSRIHLRC